MWSMRHKRHKIELWPMSMVEETDRPVEKNLQEFKLIHVVTSSHELLQYIDLIYFNFFYKNYQVDLSFVYVNANVVTIGVSCVSLLRKN